MYVVTHLWEVGRAIAAGVDVRGFSQWTIADNFEWVEGTLQRFGLYTVDFSAADRPRRRTRMADALGDIVAARRIDVSLWNTYVRDRFPSDTTAAGVGPTTADSPR